MPKRLTDEERAFRAVTEKQLQTRIIEFARLYGWRVAHFHDSRRQVKPGVFVGDKDAAGFPDLVLVRPPRLMVVELKRELGKVTDEQRAWIDDLRSCGVEVHVVRPSEEDSFRRRLSISRSAL
jgi:hypothetical protein